MIRLQRLREAKGLSKSKLSRMADLNPASVSWAESRGFRLYDVQLERLASALGYAGSPEDLLDEVEGRDHA